MIHTAELVGGEREGVGSVQKEGEYNGEGGGLELCAWEPITVTVTVIPFLIDSL